MAAAVSPPAPLLQSDLPNATAIARKRRREIVQSQRAGAAEAVAAPVTAGTDDSLPPKKRKISKAAKFPGKESHLPNNGNGSVRETETSETGTPKPKKPVDTKNKKPQMKYDPDVPMTKEEAAVWRREQRRKRNRESAAASRQRQRDRIEELEAEVEDWKAKFASVMERLKKLEEAKSVQTPSNAEDIDRGCGSDANFPAERKSLVSPSSSPNIAPQLSPDVLPVPSSLVDTRRDQAGANQGLHKQQTEETSEHHLIETISRQA